MTQKDIERKYETMLKEFSEIGPMSWKYPEIGKSSTIEIMKVQRIDELITVMQDILNELKKLNERGKNE